MKAKESFFSNPSVIKLLEEATESHVSPYLNNDEPQEKELTSSGGRADFDNGRQVTVPANAVPAGTSEYQEEFTPGGIQVHVLHC